MSNAGINTIAVSGTVIIATIFTTWDNHSGRNHQVNTIETNLKKEIGRVETDLKKEINRVEKKVDLSHGNALLFGQATLQGLDGNKEPLRNILKTMKELCVTARRWQQ